MRHKKGETLIETIVAILIMGLGSALFATMIVSAAQISNSVKGVDVIIYNQLNDIEKRERTENVGDIESTSSVTITRDGAADSIGVNQYKGKVHSLYAYWK